jgi:hypothetical protein
MVNDNYDRDRVVEDFDRQLGSLHGLPGVTSTRQATVRHVGLTESSTYIIQTFRQREPVVEEGDKPKPARDTIFLEYIGPGGKSLRLVLPPGVADVIARQRDQLTTVSRKKGAQQAVAMRRERGDDLGAHLRAYRAKRKGRGKK